MNVILSKKFVLKSYEVVVMTMKALPTYPAASLVQQQRQTVPTYYINLYHCLGQSMAALFFLLISRWIVVEKQNTFIYSYSA